MITEAINEFKSNLLVSSEHWNTWQKKTGVNDTKFFSGPHDDVTFLEPVATRDPNTSGSKRFCDLCLARHRQDLIVISHCSMRSQKARITVAKLCLQAAQRKETSWLVPDAEHATFQQSDDLRDVYSAANSSLDELYNYASAERPECISENEVVCRVMSESLQAVRDGRDIIKVIIHDYKSRWHDTMKTIQNALDALTPPDWRKFTIEIRDDAKIMSEIIDNDDLNFLLPKLQALNISWVAYTTMLGYIGEKPTYEVAESCGEARLLIAVRAATTVTLRKLPSCLSGKSKAATVREAKKLIKDIDVVVPAVIMQRMDDAAV